MKVTEVVAALIWRGGKILICRRPAHKARALLWEFAGGKVETGETKAQALIRECCEELGITLKTGCEFMQVQHVYPDITINLTLLNAEIIEGEPQLKEHCELKWVTVNELDGYEFCPADAEIIKKLKQCGREQKMQYKIRVIEERDNKAVEQVIRTCLIEFGANREGLAWADPDLGEFSRVYSKPGTKYWVAEDADGKIVGGTGIGPWHDMDGVCELQKMYCLPEARGTGLAQQLMERALLFAAQHYRRCYLETLHTMAAANRFYEKFGFKALGAPLSPTEHFACDAWYIKDLPQVKLCTQRLILRELIAGDLAAIKGFLQDAEVMYAWEAPFTDREAEAWLQENLRRYQSDGFSFWAVQKKDSAELLGVCGPLMETIDGARHTGVAYIFARQHWGCGYAAEAAFACVQYAFDKLGAEEVIAEIRPENKKSRRVAERLGMAERGSFVKTYKGRAMPHLIYAVTRPQ